MRSVQVSVRLEVRVITPIMIFAPEDVTLLDDQLNGFIGGGNFDIHKCKVNNELKALKLFHASGDKCQIEAEYEAIRRELDALSKVPKSPNVISLLGMVKHKTFYGVLMEYAPRGNLEAFVEKFRPSFSVRLKLLCDVAAGLDQLHHKVSELVSISHNDLSPTNVVLDATFTAKICDFEGSDVILRSSKIARSDDSQRQEIICYPLRYAAPELLKVVKGKGEKIKRRRSMDVFSFSMITYFMLTGKHPYSSISDRIICYDHLIDSRPYISSDHYDFELLAESESLLQSLTGLMERCWDRNPDYRPKAQELFKSLKEFLKCIREEAWKNEIEKMTTDNPIDSEDMSKFVLPFHAFCTKVDNCRRVRDNEQQQEGTAAEGTSATVDREIIRLQNYSINANPGQTVILDNSNEEVECLITAVRKKKT